MGLLKSWGIGARLVFEAGRARSEMDQTERRAKRVRKSMTDVGKGGAEAGAGLATTEKKARKASAELNALAGSGAKNASAGLAKTNTQAKALRKSMAEVGKGAREAGHGLTQLWMSIVPIGIASTAAIVKGSQLAAEMEGNILTMRILIGDAATATKLLQDLREEAARTPFEETDLIGASKVLLSLTKGNVAETKRLLKMSETMAALEPEKTVRDAAMALQDAMQGSGIERLVEFPGLSIRAEDLGEKAGKRGGAAWMKAMAAEVEARLGDLTKGEDLVGALSKTFSGRTSTLRDTISNVLRDVGKTANDSLLGPMVDSATLFVQELAPAIREGFGMVATDLASFRDQVSPVFGWLRQTWEGLGSETQARVMSWITWFGMFAAVLVPVGGVILGVVSAVIGLGSALWASWGAISGFLGVVSTMGLPLLYAMAVEAAQVAAAFAVLGYLGGDAWFGTLASAGQALWWVLSSIASVLWEVGAGLLGGLWEGLQPVIQAVDKHLRPSFRELVKALGEVFAKFQGTTGGAGVLGSVAHWLGETIGWLATYILIPAVRVLESMINVITGVAGVIAPLVEWVLKLGSAFFGVLDGSLSLREALGLVLMNTAEGAIRIVRTLAQTLLRVVADMIRGVAALVDGVPGMGWAARWMRRGAGKVEGAADAAGGMLDGTLKALEYGQSRIERARAERMAPTVNVQAGETTVQVELEHKTTLDGREVSRSQGKAAVRDGERGRGPKTRPSRMGRVLRGATVGALRPAEAVAGG